jgi:hypothetical protein
MDLQPTVSPNSNAVLTVAAPTIPSTADDAGAIRPGPWYTVALATALIILVGAAVLVHYQPMSGAFAGTPMAAQTELSYVVDLDFWQRTPRERTVASVSHFDLDHDLNAVPMQVGDWVGEDRPETNEEVLILLEPEQYVQRLYQNGKGQYLWLSMVGGRSSQPFHAPDICYDADGWQYNLGSHPVALDGGGELYGLYLTAHKELPDGQGRAEHVVYYFYLFPNESRSLSDGIVLFKLTSGRVGTVEETLAMQEDFVRQFFTAASATRS